VFNAGGEIPKVTGYALDGGGAVFYENGPSICGTSAYGGEATWCFDFTDGTHACQTGPAPGPYNSPVPMPPYLILNQGANVTLKASLYQKVQAKKPSRPRIRIRTQPTAADVRA
jgi:hypothetical protein